MVKMADDETKAEWEKSKRIDVERMKTARALSDEKHDSCRVSNSDEFNCNWD